MSTQGLIQQRGNKKGLESFFLPSKGIKYARAAEYEKAAIAFAFDHPNSSVR
jgi:hypothetical protein